MLSFPKTIKFTALLSLILAALVFQNHISAWWIFALFFLFFCITIIGSFHIRWNYFLKSKNHNHTTSKNEVAITFDDGPHPEFTSRVLDLLKKHNSKATFFCIGKNIEKYPEIVKRIVSEGHLLGNHSYGHENNFGFLSTKEINEDLNKTQRLLKTITDNENVFFRPPFGVTNPNIAKAIKKLNLHSFGWSIRSLDTIAKSPNKVLAKIEKKLRKGSIILLHDTSDLSCNVLEQLLHLLEKKKLKTVTLKELFNTEKHES